MAEGYRQGALGVTLTADPLRLLAGHRAPVLRARGKRQCRGSALTATASRPALCRQARPDAAWRLAPESPPRHRGYLSQGTARAGSLGEVRDQLHTRGFVADLPASRVIKAQAVDNHLARRVGSDSDHNLVRRPGADTKVRPRDGLSGSAPGPESVCGPYRVAVAYRDRDLGVGGRGCHDGLC